MKRGRAQYSLEFLVTYGWALLILGVIIGTIYSFGWIDPANYMPQKCTFYGQIGCKDYYLSTELLNLSLTNNFGTDLIIDGINLSKDGQSLCSNSDLKQVWKRQGNAIINLDFEGCSKVESNIFPGTRVDITVQVSYFSNNTCSECWTKIAGCDDCLHKGTGRILTRVSR